MAGMMKTTKRHNLITRRPIFALAGTVAALAGVPVLLSLPASILAPLAFGGVALLLIAVGVESALHRPVSYARPVTEKAQAPKKTAVRRTTARQPAPLSTRLAQA